MIQKAKNKIHKTLRWSEKYLKTDMVYIAKGGSILTSGHTVSSVVVFLVAIAFANLIPKETYGTYKYALSIVGLLSMATLSGVGGALLQSVSRGNEGTFIPALKTKLKWGVLGAVASLGVSLYYFINDNQMLAIIFAITSLFIPFMDSMNLYQSYLQGKKLFLPFTIYITASQIIASAVMVLTIFYTDSIYAIIIAYYAAWTLVRVYFHFKVMKKFPPNDVVDSEVIPYGKHSSFIDAIASVVSSAEKILIFHFLGPVPLAIYSFAQAPLAQFSGLFRNIPTLAIPKLASRPIPEINKILKKRVLWAFVFALGAVVIYIALAPFFFKLVFPQYLESIPFSRWLSLTMLFVIPQTILGAATHAKLTLTPRKALYLWNIPGITSVIIIYFTIQSSGLYSLVIARLAFVALVSIITFVLWQKIRKVDREN